MNTWTQVLGPLALSATLMTVGACDSSKAELESTRTQLLQVSQEREQLKTQLDATRQQLATAQHELEASKQKAATPPPARADATKPEKPGDKKPQKTARK
jgi:uncharacterized protein (DUF3084 family)